MQILNMKSPKTSSLSNPNLLPSTLISKTLSQCPSLHALTAMVTISQHQHGTEQDRGCTQKRNTKARSRNHCCRGKTIRITYSGCVSAALVIQHATRIRRITLYLWHFSKLSHKRHDFREKSY